MFAIAKISTSDKTRINILPCQIKHNGAIKVTKQYWQPRIGADNTRTTHFRGRRLRGNVIKIPEEYQGLVLKTTDKTIVEPSLPTEDDEEPELPELVKVVEEVATFDEMVIWGHDQVPAWDDNLVKGVEEWIAFAKAIHSR